MIQIRQYLDRTGKTAFGRWFDRLDDNLQARVTVYLDRLERGNTGSIKPIEGTLQELRMDFGAGYRIYFGWDGKQLVLLLLGADQSGVNPSI